MDMQKDNAKVYEKLLDVAAHLGEIKIDIRGIHQRLDTLNGSVARHEKAISDLKVSEAQIFTRLTQVLEDDNFKKQIKSQRSNIWYERLIWLGALVLLAVLSSLNIITFSL